MVGALDIAVAGCGPAGLAAALLLARDGHRVRLFERFDTPRPVGSGLMIQPAGLAIAVRMRRRHVLLYQALSRVFTPAYQSDGAILPWLRDRIVRPLARIGPARRAQAAMVTGLFGGPLRPLGLDP